MSDTYLSQLDTVSVLHSRPADRIVRRLGVGNGGEVFEAIIHGTTCAIKVYKKQKKIENELAAYLAIAHVPKLLGRVCAFYGCYAHVQKLFPKRGYLDFALLLAYLPGPTLDDKILHLSPAERTEIHLAVKKTLRLLHKDAGVIQGSMYGRNIIILDDGELPDRPRRYRPVVLDFTSAAIRYRSPPALLDPLSAHVLLQTRHSPALRTIQIPAICTVAFDLIRLQLRHAYLHFTKAYLEALESKNEGEGEVEQLEALAKTVKSLHREIYPELRPSPFARQELAITRIERKVTEQITLNNMDNSEVLKSTNEELQTKDEELKKKCAEQQDKYDGWKRILRDTHELNKQVEAIHYKIKENFRILNLEAKEKGAKEEATLEENTTVKEHDSEVTREDTKVKEDESEITRENAPASPRGEKASDISPQSQDAKLALATTHFLEAQRMKRDMDTLCSAATSTHTERNSPQLARELDRKLELLQGIQGTGEAQLLVNKARTTVIDAKEAVHDAEKSQRKRFTVAYNSMLFSEDYYKFSEACKTLTREDLGDSRNSEAVGDQQSASAAEKKAEESCRV